MKVKNIEWIVSDETEENSFENDAEILASLPNEVELPVDLSLDDYDDEDEFYDAISEWLSDTYGYLHNGFELQKIDDSKIEKLWDSLTDVLLDDNECLVSDWKLWKAGTNKEEIWMWFDKHHTKGVYYLLYER